MKVSWNWLKRYADLENIDPVKLATQFTLAVAEIDEVFVLGEGLENCRIVKIEKVEDHPSSDKLHLATINLGNTTRTVVCGAPNAREGLITVLADEGSVVKSGVNETMTIGKAVVRGIESVGMLASPFELGLSDDHSGIIELPPDAPVGMPLTQAAPVKDVVWEIDNKSLTHRPDLWGHAGIAREVASLAGRKLFEIKTEIQFTNDAPLKVTNLGGNLCPRYTAFTMDGIQIAPSPLWMQILLYHAGMRPINNVVDFTNYVMLTTGNPLHAFDRRDITDDTIIVRTAAEGEEITTLDGGKHTLSATDLLIADSHSGIALAGIMGGANSEVKDDTVSIVLESANFHPGNIRKTALRLALRTESSSRFEKSLDPANCITSSNLFASLVLENIPQSRVTSRYYDECNWEKPEITIFLSCDFTRLKLGFDITDEKIKSILTSLDFDLTETAGGFNVSVPSWRATKDISIPEDLVEEIGRIYGYDNIAPSLPLVPVQKPWTLPSKTVQRKTSDILTLELGFSEVMNYSFDKTRMLSALNMEVDARLEMANPISQMEPVLKKHLVPNMLANVELNEKRYDHFRIYEHGRVFLPRENEIPEQPRHLGFLIADRTLKNDEDLYYQVKYCVETLCSRLETGPLRFEKVEELQSWIHPSKSARVVCNGMEIGYLTTLNPIVKRKLGLESQVALGVLNIDTLAAMDKKATVFRPIPRFPGISYDITVVIDPEIRASSIIDVLESINPEIISDVRCIGYFEGAKYAGKRAVSFRMDFIHPQRTLKQEEVNEIHNIIVEKLAESTGGQVLSVP
ncbi:phenylalanine--tRNA ligase subunit beta [Myxococcota bacterium]|nr:phenylalanine--tRNA ligase subunit beta [Myxococcota bacterium]MBU1381217.1 phenylalanine--tRNA ligase subunit beta [Myxococcota bacterium]MBU1496270.1 phenylalanine--tRNA ligase subunit beta [Myxococcota bacterium]